MINFPVYYGPQIKDTQTSLSLSLSSKGEGGEREIRAMTHAAKHRSGALSAREGCSADKIARAAPRNRVNVRGGGDLLNISVTHPVSGVARRRMRAV